jgi:hypothetical protein
VRNEPFVIAQSVEANIVFVDAFCIVLSPFYYCPDKIIASKIWVGSDSMDVNGGISIAFLTNFRAIECDSPYIGNLAINNYFPLAICGEFDFA